jgi:sulfate adenylyltransferase (ADP) / ATP adenylyltransferase
MKQAMSLWNATIERTRRALAAGALDPIETDVETMDDAGVRFIVRRVASLARKAAQRAASSAHDLQGRAASKAFPVERELLVTELGATHVALLNKFPAIPHHLLLVTRNYVPQDALLDLADFAALAACLQDFAGLGFYNGGAQAGASQPHKHLQVVPLPLGAADAVPTAALFGPVHGAANCTAVRDLPFRHALAWTHARANLTGERLFELYQELLAAAGITAIDREGIPHQSVPYNLLATADWMLLVPRSREDFAGISINALGYAGSIFVKNTGELARVREAGPMAMLTAAAVS